MNLEGTESGSGWKWTFLASMANYIDAGSIVAGAAGLSLWQNYFHMSHPFVGLLAAVSSNGISAGVGALLGGRICDLFGRKRIYSWDLLVYAFGILWIIFAQAPWMLIVGYVIVGLAVGADIPASWTIIAEQSPSNARGKHSGLAIILWNTGPIVCLLMAFGLSSLGVLGIRIVFVQLLVVALITWAMRRGMVESVRWRKAVGGGQPDRLASRRRLNETLAKPASGFRALFKRPHFGALMFCICFFGIWNLEAGTNGFFFPYILNTVGAQTHATSVLMQCLGFFLGLVSTALLFMPLNDRMSRKLLFGIGALLQVAGMLLFAIFPLTVGVAFGYVLLNNIGGGIGQRPFFQVWSAELFPTMLRSTAQGFAYGIVRFGVGLWSLVVPTLTATGFHTLAWLLTGFLFVSAVIGFIGAPNTRGKSLEQIEAERQFTNSIGISG